MLLTWSGRAVGDRFGPARLLPLFIGAGYLLLVQDAPPDTADWLVTLAAGVIFLGGGAFPLAVSLAESALLLLAHPLVSETPVAAKVVASVALLELAVRRPPREALLGTAVLITAYVLLVKDHETVTGLLAVGYRVVVVAVAPLLLGAYLRATDRALAQARARAREAEARRELAARGARLAERTELARELHDLVAHHVSSMALRVNVARAVLPDLDPRVRAVLDDVYGSATTTLADLRRLVAVLRDPAAVAPEGGPPLVVEPAELPAAVAAVVERAVQAGLDVRARVDPGIAHLDAVRGLAVLRVVQEGLTNATKHAGSGSRITVEVAVAEGDARVEVRDDGGPAEVSGDLPGGPGFGLIGLRERVGLVGGTLTAGPHDGGWRLCADLPERCSSGAARATVS
ncbi:sensor histidine kinase [Streptomyces hainanensis]|uniref:histidine kinase n=1 Tax=Streptomyces hainanensis TaxID=402648 RepID=A0A4R4T5K9_9ACTN|nr:histidine kinase [Streptomyces hainanensis]TDC72147.1 two-component sensor histidine kinase [Streptomyces hainanensis]